MEVSDNRLNFIRQFEGCELAAYQDAVGVWTIGYGWTNPVDGVAIHEGMTITRQRADELLSEGVKLYERGVTDLVTAPLNQNQFDALVSFTYNVGISAFAGSTLLKKLNVRDYAGAADEFSKWVNAGGRQLAGLATRRAAERKLFLC